MDKDRLPSYSQVDELASHPRWRRRRRHGPPKIIKLLVLACVGYTFYHHWSTSRASSQLQQPLISADRLQEDYARCKTLRSKPHDPSGPRTRSGRYVDGHHPVLIRNATVWTGEPAPGTTKEEEHVGKGYSWINADVLLEYGLIKRVEAGIKSAELPEDCVVYNAHGRQLTAGIVDMHSHTAVDTLPALRGSSDDNELSNDITPYVRSIDGLNPLDPQIQVIKSGGVTTSLILPGSGNNMGGEAYVIKHAVGESGGRSEISADDMLADPEGNWRYMKMACGENAKRVYGRVGRDFGPFSRLGEAWYFRHAFEEATALVEAQNDWCSAADRIGPEHMHSYLPRNLKWESLGALLRGQILLNVHCYTVPDLEAFVRHTNEFNFSVRAFHHAHQTYLVPEILKRAYGDRPPASALFADLMYFKAESYIASEQAGRILWESGLTPVYVSDNPVTNAQHVVFEAAKAYRNGLPYHVALAGVTSASAELLGLGERIGKIKPGFDADVVVWDSDPLSVGATPVQVWIDGTPQFENPVELEKPLTGPIIPKVRPLESDDSMTEYADVVFRSVSRVLIPDHEMTLTASSGDNVVFHEGKIVCIGDCSQEVSAAKSRSAKFISLRDGYLAPVMTAFGTSLGMVEIEGEEDTKDGSNSEESFSRAVDGLAFDNKNLHVAYSRGVTKAISAPSFESGGFKGISVGFSTGAGHALEQNAVWREEVALHYNPAKTSKSSSISSAVGSLRAKLFDALAANLTAPLSPEQRALKSVVTNGTPLVINAHSADLIASLLRIKADLEDAAAAAAANASEVRMIILGGAESHLLAEELASAKVGVVLTPMLSFRASWDERRALPGAPLTNGTAIDILHAAGVEIAIGAVENSDTRNLILSAGIAFANGGGNITETDALGFVSSNVYKMLGFLAKETPEPAAAAALEPLREFVVYDGHPLTIDGRVRAVADGRGKVGVWS